MESRAVRHNFERDPPKDYPSQVWFNSVQKFQRRRFKCESSRRTTDGHQRTTDAKWWQKFTWPLARWAKKYHFWLSDWHNVYFVADHLRNILKTCFNNGPIHITNIHLVRHNQMIIKVQLGFNRVCDLRKN